MKQDRWQRQNDVGRAIMRSGMMTLSLVFACVPIACRPTEPEVSKPDPFATNESVDSTKLQQAFDFLARSDEFDQRTVHSEIVKHLQQWYSGQALDPNWEPDPLFSQLPPSYRRLVSRELLSDGGFELYDGQVLQEANWMRDTARSIIELNQPSPETSVIISQLQESVPADHVTDVSRALRLFDWTVRHLQLDRDVHPGDQHRLESDVILHGWENLLFGRGTMVESSRVFLLMCRQMGLPVVMLAINPKDQSSAPRPWLPALLLEDQLYLFDMRLGTPMPGPGGASIATLSQVAATPELLDPMEIRPDFTYPVTADDLSRVVALIDATPACLSRRMQVLEHALWGEYKLVLSISPSSIAQALAKSPGLMGVGLWTHPYHGFIVRGRIQQNQTAVVSLGMEHGLFGPQLPLGAGRLRELRGRFQDVDDQPGARALYLECRTSEQHIQSMASVPLQTNANENSAPPSAEALAAHQQRLAGLQSLMRRAKEYASYSLGLMAYDRGQYDVAIDFLDKRLLRVAPETRWFSGATYNLGRAYESRGHARKNEADLQRAVEIYESLDDVPLAAASHWRAQRLRFARTLQEVDSSKESDGDEDDDRQPVPPEPD